MAYYINRAQRLAVMKWRIGMWIGKVICSRIGHRWKTRADESVHCRLCSVWERDVKVKGFKLPEPKATYEMLTPVETEPGFFEHGVKVNDPLTTRERRDRFQVRCDRLDEAEFGGLIQEFFGEAAHGGWEGYNWREVRTIYKLMADMDIWIGCYDGDYLEEAK